MILHRLFQALRTDPLRVIPPARTAACGVSHFFNTFMQQISLATHWCLRVVTMALAASVV